ncbi:hypothetical protein [Haloflavibacter putidus]|uniref:Uncharacterized protein n=1 Tax=Haloflavibacter putidus TaxID=2576776 RepID=A0A507ZN81_9FLAO|nr:hypothetical protein [Haloflavibacter putidus]TQD39000.1 hypothetical protein FKR84_06260 [Haloflavibacter putidus]
MKQQEINPAPFFYQIALRLIFLHLSLQDLFFTVSIVNEKIIINFNARGNPIFIEVIVALMHNPPKLEGLVITVFEEADSTAAEIKNGSIFIKAK